MTKNNNILEEFNQLQNMYYDHRILNASLLYHKYEYLYAVYHKLKLNLTDLYIDIIP